MDELDFVPLAAGFAVLVTIAVPAAAAQCPTVKRVQNHTDGPMVQSGFCDEVTGEGEGALISTIPPADFPIQIVRVGIGWSGNLAGFASTEAAIKILPGDPLGMTVGPAHLYSLANPQLVEGQVNVFDVSAATTPWVVGTQPFVVFVESNGTTCDAGTMGHDADGCSPNANRFHPLYFPFLAGWYDSCVYPFPQGAIGGDAVVWVEYVSTNPCPTGTTYCYGDGTGTPCPCGNAGLSGRGCENSFTTGGGRLEAHGLASVASDSLQLRGSFLPPTSSALFFQGTARVEGGAGSAFGDGLRCVGGSTLRMGTNFATGGLVEFGYAVAGDPLVSVAGGLPLAGGSREYQVWYRNAPVFCTLQTFNLTNAITVAWSP